jgi:RNA-directed DNA polymerase
MARNGFEMVRYADDFIVLCSSQGQAQAALEQVRRWVEENDLSLHPIKTRQVDASLAGGFDFLGYHFERGMKWPRKKSMDKLKDTVFGPIEAYIRGRLRSILRRRLHKKGRGRGIDNQRWPNAYFSTVGLFSLKQAHAAACRSS